MKALHRWAARTLAVSAVALPLRVAAQSIPPSAGPAQAPRIPVTVAMVQALPEESAGYVILWQPGRARADIILVRADADEQTLSDAVRATLMAQRQAGETRTTGRMLRMRSSSHGRAPVLPWAARVLSDLRGAAPRKVEGVGEVKAVEIWLPRPQPGRRPDE